MKLIEVLRVLAVFASAFISMFMVVEQRVIRRLRGGAATADAATVSGPLGPVSRWRLRHLRSTGVVVAGGDGRLRLDETAYRDLRKRRRALGFTLLFVVVVAILGKMALG